MNQPECGAATVAGVKDLLATLNSLHVGELSRLHAELERVRRALADLGQADLEQRVVEAQSCLRRGEMKEFRRALANVTSRLGHLK